MTPTSPTLQGPSKMYFSYGQFIVYDESESLPGSQWTEAHSKQGFVRRERTIGFATLLEHGHAYLRVKIGRVDRSIGYKRVISVPLHASSGVVRIEGPEEYPVERLIHLDPSWYLICAAQDLVSDEEELVDLYIRALETPEARSEILVADNAIEPQHILLETGEASDV